MSFKTELQISHGGRIKKRVGVIAVLSSFLLSSYTVLLPHTVKDYFTMTKFLLKPYSGKDQTVNVTFKIEDPSYHYDFGGEILIANPGSNNDSIQINTLVPDQYGVGYFSKGDEISYSLTLKKEWFQTGATTHLHFRVWVAHERDKTYEDWRYYALDVSAGSLYPMTITSKMLPFLRDRTKTYASFCHDFITGTTCFGLNGEGFEDEYVADKYGTIPLNKMKLYPSNYNYEMNKPLEVRSAELRIYDYLEDFHIGPLFVDENKNPYLSVELEPYYEKYRCLFRCKNELYITNDLRYQSASYSDLNYNALKTKEIFLPPVKGFEVRNYRCRLIVYGTGEGGVDTFTHDFKVVKTGNYFGSKINSDFFVKEVFNV